MKAQTEKASETDIDQSVEQGGSFSQRKHDWSERIERKKFDYEKTYLDGGSISIHNKDIFDFTVPP